MPVCIRGISHNWKWIARNRQVARCPHQVEIDGFRKTGLADKVSGIGPEVWIVRQSSESASEENVAGSHFAVIREVLDRFAAPN